MWLVTLASRTWRLLSLWSDLNLFHFTFSFRTFRAAEVGKDDGQDQDGSLAL